MNKFEKLIEYIINEDEAKAKALFHQIVVDKSRDIYESLVEDDMEDGSGAESLGDEISADQDVIDGDEEGMDDGDEFGGDDMGDADDEFGGDDMGDEMGGEGDIEDRVMDLEDAIDELKAEFDSLMGAEEDEGHDDLGGDEFGGDADMDGEDSDFGGDMEGGDDVGVELGDDGADMDDEEESASIYGESKSGKSPAELMREYVEKVGQDFGKNNPTEGDPIGSGGTKSPINSKSNVISGKNDMGGTTANIAQGKSASDRDQNTSAKKPSNYLTKGETKMGQDKYENSPAANTKGYKDKRTVKREQEGQTTKETVPVVKKSFNPGGTPGFKG